MSKANILSVNLYYQKPVGQTALGMCLKDLSSLFVFSAYRAQAPGISALKCVYFGTLNASQL